LRLFLLDIISKAEVEKAQDILDIFTEVSPKEQEHKIMTIPEKLREEGMQRGAEQWAQDRLEIARVLLKEGKTIAYVAKLVKLTAAQLRLLRVH
jgi:predicted transposase YdaD